MSLGKELFRAELGFGPCQIPELERQLGFGYCNLP